MMTDMLRLNPEFWNHKKVLVTGGAGLLGSHTIDLLLELGADVTVIDDLSTGHISNLPMLDHQGVGKELDYMEGDIIGALQYARLPLAIDETNIVLHLAAHMLVKKSVTDPQPDFNTNMLSTWKLLETCRKRAKSLERFVFASSCGVYGNTAAAELTESDACPNSPYGAAKLASETYGLAYQRCYGLPFSAIRFFSLYGPRMRQTVLYDLLSRLVENPKELTLWGTGEVVRDFTYVQDAAKVLLAVAERPEAIGQVYNFSGGQPYSIREVVYLILEQLGLSDTTAVRTSDKPWAGDMTRLVSDNWKICQLLRDELPTRSLRHGLLCYYDWLTKTLGWKLENLRNKN